MRHYLLSLFALLTLYQGFSQIKQGDNGLFGYYNPSDDTWMVEPLYDKIERIPEWYDENELSNRVYVYKDGKVGLGALDTIYIEPIYDRIEVVNNNFPFEVGSFIFEVEKEGKIGLRTMRFSSRVIYDKYALVDESSFGESLVFEMSLGKNKVLLSAADLRDEHLEPYPKYPKWTVQADYVEDESPLIIYWGKEGCDIYQGWCSFEYTKPHTRFIGNFDDYGLFSDDRGIMVRKDGKLGLIYQKQIALNLFYDHIDLIFENADQTILESSYNGRKGAYSFFSEGGSIVVPLLFDEIVYTGMPFEESELAFVRRGDKWGIYSFRSGMITPLFFDDMAQVEEAEFYVSLDGKWGKIYSDGWSSHWLSRLDGSKPGRHSETDFSGTYNGDNPAGFVAEKSNSSLQVFEEDGKYGYYYDAEIYCPPIYDDIDIIGNDLLLLKRNGKIGLSPYAPLFGTSIIYDRIEALDEDSTEFRLYSASEQAYYNASDGVMIEGGYETIKQIDPTLFLTSYRGSKGVHDLSGAVAAPIYDDVIVAPDTSLIILTKNNRKAFTHPHMSIAEPREWCDSIKLIQAKPAQYLTYQDGQVGFYSREYQLNPYYDHIEHFDDSQYLLLVEKDGNKGLRSPEMNLNHQYERIEAVEGKEGMFLTYDKNGFVNLHKLSPPSYSTTGENDSIVLSENVEDLVYLHRQNFWVSSYKGSWPGNIGYANIEDKIAMTENKFSRFKEQSIFADSISFGRVEVYFIKDGLVSVMQANREESYKSSNWLKELNLGYFTDFEKIHDYANHIVYQTFYQNDTGFIIFPNQNPMYDVRFQSLEPTSGVESFLDGQGWFYPDSIGGYIITPEFAFPEANQTNVMISKPVVLDSFATFEIYQERVKYDEAYNEQTYTDTSYAIVINDLIMFQFENFNSLELIEDESKKGSKMYFLVEKNDQWGVVEMQSKPQYASEWKYIQYPVLESKGDALQILQEKL